METKIKNYLLVFGLGIITLTSCNHSKEQDIVASNFAFAEQQLKIRTDSNRRGTCQ